MGFVRARDRTLVVAFQILALATLRPNLIITI